jgi:glycosyltransferase involved in cell wall biosynthesis
VYLDAACCQIPCIATRSGGAAEAVEDGVTGIVCEPDDDLDLARAVKRLLDSPETAARFGAAGRERVLRHFTWRKCAERVLLGKTATVG